MGATVRTKKLAGRDVLIARRQTGGRRVRQRDLAKALGMRPEAIVAIEHEQIELSQEQYRRLLGVIEKLAAERAERAD